MSALPETATLAPPQMTRLVLSRAGRRVVFLFIVLGVLAYAGLFTVGVVTGAREAATARKLIRDHNEAVTAFQSYGEETRACAGVGGVDCFHDADLRLAGALERFEHQLDGLRFPANAADDASHLRAD